MRYLVWLLISTAIANVAYKAIELAGFHHSAWPWVSATMAALIAIEVADYKKVMSETTKGKRGLALRFWTARLLVIVVLATLRVDANVIRDSTERVRRDALHGEISMELAKIRAA